MSFRYPDVSVLGCISQLDIGDGLIDFGFPDETSEMIGVVRCKPCGSHNEDNPCENDGLCIESHTMKTGFECKCAAGFGGELCETATTLNRARRPFERPARAALRKTNSTFKALKFHSVSSVQVLLIFSDS